MAFHRIFRALSASFAGVIGPRYQPEKHYMRGFGPACAARARAAAGS